MTKYPAKEHASRTAANYEKLFNEKPNFLIYVAATKTQNWAHSDQQIPLHQNRYFNYLTGAWNLPDCHVLYNPESDWLTLYLPEIDEDDVMWSGMPISPAEAQAKFDVNEVKYVSHLKDDITNASKPVYAIEEAPEFPVVKVLTRLQEALDETRMIKDTYELDLMRKASQITDNSHLAVMNAMPIEKNEGHIQAEFVYHAMRQGSKNQAYDPICCSGTNCGTLHYVKNDDDIGSNRQLVLIDAGAEWQCYAADVTRVFPVSGVWTPEARTIYDLVFDMQKQTMELVRPGVEWDDLHLLAHRILIRKFLELGIFANGSEDEIFDSGISAAFFPHGLGHMLGMDTHDTGGRANYNDTNPMLRYLRIRRRLEKNMVVTVEPGCYFNDFLIKPHISSAEKSKYIDTKVLQKYMPVGGVRIEDDVLVTEDGFENLTKITKNADEVAKLVKEGLERGSSHFHNLV